MFKRGAKGFTLVELLAVVAIIGILMSIVTVSVSSSKAKSRDSRRIADIKNIQLALAQYYSDNYMYPINIYASSAGTAPNNGLAGGYLATVPYDPSISGACSSTGLDASCYKYTPVTTYNVAGNCNASSKIPNRYHLGAILEDSANTELARDVNLGLVSTYSAYTCGSFAPPDFDGTKNNCSSGTPNNCYDVSN